MGRNNAVNAKNAAAPQSTAIVVLQVVAEILLMLVKSLYFLVESVFKLIVPSKERSVKGEIVLVTGAGHGIGREVALQYASHGATVIAWDINDANNKATVKEIKQRGYPTAYDYVCDVSNRATVFEVVEQVRKDVGDISIIVNNAGIMPTHSLLDHTQDEIERIFKINVFAHFWIIQAILPSMIKNKRGHIVALSSCAGIMGLENLVPYCSSKFAVFGMMESIYQELKMYPNCNVKTTVICPYMVDTGLCKNPKVRFESLMPMLKPNEVASAIVSAQRRDVKVTTLPSYVLYMNNFFRCSPMKTSDMFKDFASAGLDSDLPQKND